MRRSEWKWERAMLLIAIAAAVLAVARGPAPVLDVTVTNERAGAMLRIGFASVRIMFDSGRDCPDSNGCAVPRPGSTLVSALGTPAGTGVAKS